MKNLLLFVFGVSLAGVTGYHYFQAGLWKTALQGWQQAVTERDAELDAARQQLLACQATPTPAPVALIEMPTPVPVVDTLAHDRAAAAEIEPALSRLIAATKVGVTYQRYLVLMEEIMVAIQGQQNDPLQHSEYKAALSESLRAVEVAGQLWTACLNEDLKCRDLTKWVIKTYPAYPDPDKIQNNVNAISYLDKTLSFLWSITAQRFQDAQAL